eukprot:scaffold157584_cov13-Tisochrysis_lutea.AAC.1
MQARCAGPLHLQLSIAASRTCLLHYNGQLLTANDPFSRDAGMACRAFAPSTANRRNNSCLLHYNGQL